MSVAVALAVVLCAACVVVSLMVRGARALILVGVTLFILTLATFAWLTLLNPSAA